jgi:zinc and cadmium transporter
MGSVFAWIVAFTIGGAVLGVLAAALFLLVPERLRTRFMPWFVSFAIGALLGAAFLGLLPEAFETPDVDVHHIAFTVLVGLLSFFLLEKMVLWRHCHTHDCEVHGSEHDGHDHDGHEHHDHSRHDHAANYEHAKKAATGNLILIGDSIHNLVDGVLIGAAFLTDVQLGIVTSLAVIAHEIPQELGDFAILLHSGYSRAKALLYNLLASLTTVVGGVVAYYSLSLAVGILPYVLAVAASSFIYVAVADLIPGLHRRPELRATVQQMVLIGLGVAATVVVPMALGKIMPLAAHAH